MTVAAEELANIGAACRLKGETGSAGEAGAEITQLSSIRFSLGREGKVNTRINESRSDMSLPSALGVAIPGMLRSLALSCRETLVRNRRWPADPARTRRCNDRRTGFPLPFPP